MNEQPEALRLADEMERVAEYDHQIQAAAELRRLHEENIQARRTSEYWKAEHMAGNDRINILEAALRQALEALENVYGKGKRCESAITAAQQALGENK